MRRLSSLIVLMLVLAIPDAFAQQTGTASPGGLAGLLPSVEGSVSGWIVQLFGLLTVLSVAPGLLMMVTSFTRFAIAFSLLRSGLGLQTTPPNLVMISLALFMTFYVMAPTFNAAWEQGVQPLMKNEITEQQAIDKISQPFREFMISQVREKDLDLFVDLSDPSFQVRTGADIDFRILVPAFMISELRRGFEIGFLIVLPFLVIDLVVATLTMSMGMMMLPPTVISLPFKILFFVLIDGWNLLVGSLIRSF
ncbi:flagellar biosynthetic protein fliP [Bartonella bacilliformis str. Heidi Mejia]|uniref:flagellar type III secretion system pore protein FliP n=1 Tax=Bartonella bacilliformis TaxID=774 RepID=UPI00044677D4|nr:flagellar type III secretion system pore protein FliP [Bartonella bacilliformis]EYS91052.1 flagellar biosynthetic protein fliP [Bartonella bacilliformis str. Heidi Mejia]KEG16138.1 flagellar biosynthetic protein fliP [Bartonella bacilliformis Cond044]KEG18127.1 flagellar biosynthetic protein fliP [Bartonella bacilliformis Hosp800-02]KEG21755.1 flagellar biosynthetic protein fliP [Bartonella bacilliformis VAB9028]KEG23130.1 flagellar biosynthetic protein fliP [Bartonella bacilliformis CAR600